MPNETEQTAPQEESSDPASSGELLREIAWMVGGAFGLVLAASILAEFSALVASMLYLIVAAVFLFLPYRLIDKKGLSYETFGLANEHVWRDLGIGALLVVLTAAPFAGGFYLWQTQVVGQSYSFDWGNFQKWHPQNQGAPSGWGAEPGVWTWTSDRTVHVGMRAGPERAVTVDVRLDRAAMPAVRGPVELVRSDGRAEGPARNWVARLDASGERAELVFRPQGASTEAYPTRVEITVEKSGSDAARLYVGPGAEPADGGAFTYERGLRWILLWLLTQVVFIALPEEVFYRGYLQTRIRHLLEVRRREEGEGEAETRSWFGISEENLVASLVFGLAHLLIPVGGQLLATRISVAFPAVVFGWLRDRTGSITASIVYHAGCNMLVLLAAPHFF